MTGNVAVQSSQQTPHLQKVRKVINTLFMSGGSSFKRQAIALKERGETEGKTGE